MTLSDYLARWHNHRAAWVDQPEEWVWPGPIGNQGPGLHWGMGQIGIANLLWLALDMDRPPARYSARDNPLYTYLIVHAASLKLDGLPLDDQAASLTLEQFRDRCQATGPAQQRGDILPLLCLLANRRLNHAHT